MSEKTTQRPWRAEWVEERKRGKVVGHWSIWGDLMVATVEDDMRGHTEANAHLIVQAVNAHDGLVALCERAIAEIRDAQGEIRERSYIKPRLRRLEDDLRAALADLAPARVGE